MRQTKILCKISFPYTHSLCRLSPVPAGRWSFPTLSLQSLHKCLDPYPAGYFECICLFLPQSLRPFVTRNTIGTLNYPYNATSTRSRDFGAAVIRLSSDSHTCSTHRLHLLQSICIHLSSQALYTTRYLIRYRYQAVASLRDRHRQLSRLDFHQLDCSLVGCSFPHTAFRCSSLQGMRFLPT